jgi:hypothetical protein
VPLVRAYTLPGLRLQFHSNDHDPPHFHAEKTGCWEVRVFFLEEGWAMIEPVFGEPRRSELKKLLAEAQSNAVALLDEWHAVVQTKP